MLKDKKINWRRLLFEILVGSILFFMMLRGTEAEAAVNVTVNWKGSVGTHMVYDLTELDWTSYYTGDCTAEQVISECVAFMVRKTYSDRLEYYFLKKPIYYNDVSTGQMNFGVNDGDYAVTVTLLDGVWCVTDAGQIPVGSNYWFVAYNGGQNFMLGSSYDYFAYNTQTNIDKQKEIMSRNNLSYPSLFPSVSVDIAVNGTDYIVSESYPYYLALKEPSGDIQLFFSDVPFTGSFADLYTWRIEIPSDANVVWYYWDSEEQNDFLSSRTVASASTAFDSFYFTSTGDYMSNYSLPETNNPLYYFLTEKAAFNPEALTAKDLYAALPDELSKYYHIIIFRQDSSKAYDDRILFYGWNDNNANLYIHSSNSQIAALNKKGAVSDYATAYYDESLNTWVISDDVVLGATTDGSYNVPYIYHSDLDLFVCDEWNVWNGQIAYVGDDERPLVSIVDPDSPEADEQDTLIDRFLNGFSNLFKSLFVPSSGFFDAKVNYMKSKFSFYEAISSTGAAILDFFTETDFSEPPKITVNLSAARSKYNYGETAVCLDMSWYEEYKPYVDAFLSGVLWLVFGWNTFKNLPSIISGVTTAANVSTEISKASESKPVEIPKYASNAKSCPPEFMIKR